MVKGLIHLLLEKPNCIAFATIIESLQLNNPLMVNGPDQNFDFKVKDSDIDPN